METQQIQTEQKGENLKKSQEEFIDLVGMTDGSYGVEGADLGEHESLAETKAEAGELKKETTKDQMKVLAEIFDKYQPHLDKNKNHELAVALDKGELDEEQASEIKKGLEMLVEKNKDIKLPFNLEEIDIKAKGPEAKTEVKAEVKLSPQEKEDFEAFAELVNYFRRQKFRQKAKKAGRDWNN